MPSPRSRSKKRFGPQPPCSTPRVLILRFKHLDTDCYTSSRALSRSLRYRHRKMSKETMAQVGAITNRSFCPRPRASRKPTKGRNAYPRDCYIRFCKEKRPLLASHLRNATREALLGQQWRALPEAEKAQYSEVVVEAAHPYQPVAAATDMRLHAAHLCVDSPSTSQDAYASALGDRWSIYWSANQTQSAARDSEPGSSAMPSAAPSTAGPTAHATPLAPPPLAAAPSSHTMPNRCGPSRRSPPVETLPPVMPLVPPLRSAPSAPSAPIAPALRRVPTMLAAPVTPVVAAGGTPLQLQLQKLLMQTLEQMEDEAVDIL